MKLVVGSLPTVEKVERVRVSVTVGYPEIDALRRLLAERDVVVEEEEYGAEVRYSLAVPAPDLEGFRETLAELSQGRAVIDGA